VTDRDGGRGAPDIDLSRNADLPTGGLRPCPRVGRERSRPPCFPRRTDHRAAAAVEPAREFRLSPDGRRLAFTAEAAGARQIFLMPVRGGYPEQLTATEKSASDPQWSPDGRRIAFVRDEAI